MGSRMNLTDEENELYTKLFVECDLEGYGYVSGDTTCDLFRKSGLSDDMLFSIWEAADKENTGQLDFAGFCICLRLIGHVQVYGPQALNDSDVLINKPPDELPIFSGTVLSGYGALGDNYDFDPALYVISNSDFEGYKYTFLQLTPDLNDYLLGDEARNFYFETTDLSQEELKHLWMLADVDRDGRLSLREFCVMQKLCECLKAYGTLPGVLPETLVDFFSSDQVPDFASLTASKDQNVGLGEDAPVSPTIEPSSPMKPVEKVIVTDKGILEHGTNEEPVERVQREPERKERTETFITNVDMVSTAQVTNELIVQCENLLSTLRNAINSEKSTLALRDSGEIEAKLRSDTRTLENLMAEYKTLVGENQSHSRRRNLMTRKLSIVQDQIVEVRGQIQNLKVGNVALTSTIDRNGEEQSVLQNTRQGFSRQLDEESGLLRMEERELAEMVNTLQQLRRERDLVAEKNAQLRECLSQSENATKTMLRSIQLQQGKIMTVKNDRIKVLEDKLKVSNEINKFQNSSNTTPSNGNFTVNLDTSNLNQNSGILPEQRDKRSSREFGENVNRNLNLDKKGIRVSSSARLGEEFPQ